MSRYDGGWAPYVPVAERRRRAMRAMEKRRKAGHPVAPVTIEGRAIATTFWGRAWCDTMETCRDYESRLPRGRTYVRNGSVVDLQIAPGRITAVVSGSELYKVTITVKETPAAHWRAICADCSGGIDSVVELLQGRFSAGVMERLCRQQGGLLPRPAEIRFACSCPDHALMCKHVAAALYGVGARLDRQPELLFRLRGVDETELVARAGTPLPLSGRGPAAGRVLEADDVSALFGLDMAAPSMPEVPAGRPSRRRIGLPNEMARAAPQAAGVRQKAAAAKAAVEPTAKQAMTIVPPAPTKLAAPKEARGGKGAAATSSSPKRAAATKVPSKLAGQKAASSRATIKRERNTSMNARGKIAALCQAKGPSVVTAEALQAPARSRGKPQASTPKPVRTREPKQKPVKWW